MLPCGLEPAASFRAEKKAQDAALPEAAAQQHIPKKKPVRATWREPARGEATLR
jgi:hypothetical protein